MMMHLAVESHLVVVAKIDDGLQSCCSLAVAIGVAIVQQQQSQRAAAAALFASPSKDQAKISTAPPLNLDNNMPPTKTTEASSTNEPVEPAKTLRPTTTPTTGPAAAAVVKQPKSSDPENNAPPPSPMPSVLTTPTPTSMESLYATQTVVAALISGPSNSKDPQSDSTSFWTTLAPRLSLLDTATVDLALYLSGGLRVSNHRGKCKAED
jgi:hypothetical protein